MSPIPGEPHDSKLRQLVTGDGRKFTFKLPGAADEPPPPEEAERSDEDAPAQED